MSTSRPINSLILVALLFTIPAHPKNLFSYCTDVIKEQVTTKTKICVGLAALVITYALIKYVLYKYHSVYKNHDTIDKNTTVEQNQACKDEINYDALRQKEIERRLKEHAINLKKAIEESGVFLDDTLIHAIENIKDDYIVGNPYFRIPDILKCRDLKESNFISIIWSRPEILDRLIQHNMKTQNLLQWQVTASLWAVACMDLTMNKRASIGILIKHGANINIKEPGRPDPYPWPRYHERMRTPLTDAILVGTPSTVKIFLEYGANIEIEPEISAYDYVEDVGKYGGYHKSKQQVYAILDNHRRKIANEYTKEARSAVYTHLTKDTTGIIMQYVEVYPLMEKRPLTNFELVDEGIVETGY